jgi:hypothetical protein
LPQKLGGYSSGLKNRTAKRRNMTERYFYADVEQPFHVWVKEGARWVLRDAGTDLQIEGCPPLPRKPAGERGAAGINPSTAA